jgi:hypothetical protein
MTVVFKTVSFGAFGRQRQHRIQAVQSLNRRLFIVAEHGRCTVDLLTPSASAIFRQDQ